MPACFQLANDDDELARASRVTFNLNHLHLTHHSLVVYWFTCNSPARAKTHTELQRESQIHSRECKREERRRREQRRDLSHPGSIFRSRFSESTQLTHTFSSLSLLSQPFSRSQSRQPALPFHLDFCFIRHSRGPLNYLHHHFISPSHLSSLSSPSSFSTSSSHQFKSHRLRVTL